MHGIMQLIAKACTLIVLMLPYCKANPLSLTPWNKMTFHPVDPSPNFYTNFVCPLGMTATVSESDVTCYSPSGEQVSSVTATFPCVAMNKVTITTVAGGVCPFDTHGDLISSIMFDFYDNELCIETVNTECELKKIFRRHCLDDTPGGRRHAFMNCFGEGLVAYGSVYTSFGDAGRSLLVVSADGAGNCTRTKYGKDADKAVRTVGCISKVLAKWPTMHI
eukprot:CFRG1720T1